MNLLEGIGIQRISVLRGATYYGARENRQRKKKFGYIGKGYRANLIFYQGKIDTGA